MAISKSQLPRLIDDAAYALKKTEKSFKRTEKTDAVIGDFKGLPDAFPVVAKRVPVLPKLLDSIEAYISAEKETQEAKERYAGVGKLAKSCQREAAYLHDLFSAVTDPDEDVPKLERYRQAVADGNGKRIETVLKDLLEKALQAVAPPLIDGKLVKELQEAFEEVSKLKPSLKEEPKGAVTLISNGSGSQFYHGG
ncbi:hypothetical protein C8A03DRAFT_36976 [Achaetomium macrosporum]|uniref:NACHT-NTPase and P-loop NTPases N-terminal domain-containing protein n=1 Tax=Achaetomium macrosporum TaxID=79813 RepID=A0AAN7C4E9_9PEZI|nr:hypothetical protein C8A03DRAFT_36976 [Achaetomium macrosporum]